MLSASPSLDRFFDQVFVPVHLRHSSAASLRLHREALRWFARFLGRPPRTSDFNPETVLAALQSLAAAGLSSARIHELRKRLVSVWRYAAQLGVAPTYVRPPIVRGGSAERSWRCAAPAAGSLLAFYRSVFRPALAEASQQSRTGYDSAVNYYHDFAERLVALEEVTPETIRAFGDWLGRSAAISATTASGYVRFIRRIARSADAQRFPIAGGGRPKRAIGVELFAPRASSRRKFPALAGEPGTLVHFNQTIYAPQVLMETGHKHQMGVERGLRLLRECFSRDVLLAELSAGTIADFVAFLKKKGLQLGTIRNHRSRLLSLWRFAHEQGLAPAAPRFRRLKSHREQPDAWSLDEVASIVAAADRLEPSPMNGIPANKYMRAMLLVGWWTGLRRGSLLRLRTQDVDLESRWIYLPAAAMKTCVGKRFRIGEDAVAALRQIWDSSRERVFPCPGGGHEDESAAIVRRFRRILELAGVPKSRLKNGHWHKLRRTTATHVAAKRGLAAASALLGHSTADLLKRYIDPSYIVGTDATEWLPSLEDASLVPQIADGERGGPRP